MKGRVLVVAGSDSGAGAGIQADIKTIAALGGYATTAITALTAQNTLGVHASWPVRRSFVRRQMEVVLDDIGADCVKTGMLHDAAVDRRRGRGDRATARRHPARRRPGDGRRATARGCSPPTAVDALKRRLIPRATVLTPNVPEAEVLTGMTSPMSSAMRRAAEAL